MDKITDINKMSDADIVDVFTLAFESQVASLNDIGGFEAEVEREIGSEEVVVKVMIVGLAGSPTPEDFKSGKIEDAAEVTVPAEDDGGDYTFELDPAATLSLNTNDYWIFYRLI